MPNRSILGFCIVLAVLAHGASSRATGRPRPTVCSEAGIKGAAEGLCNAYCEALECDERSSRVFPRVFAKTCDRLADRFEAVAHQPLPCEPTECSECLTSGNRNVDCDLQDDRMDNGSCLSCSALSVAEYREALESAADLPLLLLRAEALGFAPFPLKPVLCVGESFRRAIEIHGPTLLFHVS